MYKYFLHKSKCLTSLVTGKMGKVICFCICNLYKCHLKIIDMLKNNLIDHHLLSDAQGTGYIFKSQIRSACRSIAWDPIIYIFRKRRQEWWSFCTFALKVFHLLNYAFFNSWLELEWYESKFDQSFLYTEKSKCL